VSDSGSETGVAIFGLVRSEAASIVAYNALTCTYVAYLLQQSSEVAVRDDEVAGSNPVTPTQVRGGISHHERDRFWRFWGNPGDETWLTDLRSLFQEPVEHRDRRPGAHREAP
jgi:hypothetical protein